LPWFLRRAHWSAIVAGVVVFLAAMVAATLWRKRAARRRVIAATTGCVAPALPDGWRDGEEVAVRGVLRAERPVRSIAVVGFVLGRELVEHAPSAPEAVIEVGEARLVVEAQVRRSAAADPGPARAQAHELELAAAVLHVDAQPHQDRGIGRTRDGGETGIGLHPVDVEFHRRQRLERQLRIGQHHLDHALDEIGFDRRVRAAFDPNRGLAAPPAQQHVDDRIDQAGIDRHQAEIVPFLRLEHG